SGSEVEADAADRCSAVLNLGVRHTQPDHLQVLPFDRKLGRDDRGATSREALDELALRPDHALEGVDQLEMHRADVGDDPDLRPSEGTELPNLAEASHRELENADLGLRLEPAERQRDSD